MERVVFHGDHVIHVGLVMREGKLPHLHRHESVGETMRVLQSHRCARLARTRELGCARGLHTHHARRGREELHRGGNARAQSTSAHWHEHQSDVRHVGHDLETRGPLAGDDRGVVVGRDEGESLIARHFHGAVHPVRGGGAGQLNARAEPLGSRALGGGNRSGHHHHGRCAEQARRERHGLRVVTRGWRDDPARELFRGEAREVSVRASELESPAALEHLGLEPDVRRAGDHVGRWQ